MGQALAAIHQADSGRHPVTLVYSSIEGRVALSLSVSEDHEGLVTTPITAHYPNCSLIPVKDAEARSRDDPTWFADLELSPELFPILRHAQFEDLLNGTFADPVGGILRAVMPDDAVQCRIEIRITPATPKRCREARLAVRLLDREFFRGNHRRAEYFAKRFTSRRGWFYAWLLSLRARSSPQSDRSSLDTSSSRQHDREERLQAGADKVGGHLFETGIRLVVYARPDDAPVAVGRIQQMAGAFGAFTLSRLATFQVSKITRGAFPPVPKQGFLMSHEEVATLFHPPTASVAAENMQVSEFAELEPPPKSCSGEEPDAVAIGRTLFRGHDGLIGIDADARRRHVYIVGSTGAGKSTLLVNLIRQDMQAGRGLTVIDVHGDLADAALRLVPRHRTNETVIFDAAAENVVPFNPLACPDPSRIDQVTSGVVSAFKKLYDSWGPRLENLMRYTVFTTVEQGGTLLQMLQLLTDKAYRDQVVARVSDEVVRSFWTNEFAAWNAPYRTEAVSSVTNKLMPFLTSRQLRAITSGSNKQSLDLRRVMDEQQILIVNISRGRLGQDNATLLGSLLLTSIEQATMTRAEIPEHERRDHYLYLDEFQSLTTPSTAIMLSESRKYRLCLTLSHQLTKQLDPDTYHSVIGNCGTILAFRVGLEDAVLLAPALSKHPGQLTPADLCNLPNYTAYSRLLIDGQPSRPFSLRTLPPDPSSFDEERAEIVRRTSERRYATAP